MMNDVQNPIKDDLIIRYFFQTIKEFMKKPFLQPIDTAFLREEYITDAEYLETRDFKYVF